jgi:hypothetical protein
LLKNVCADLTKVNEGESNTPCPSTLEVTYSSVEKLSKALSNVGEMLLIVWNSLYFEF